MNQFKHVSDLGARVGQAFGKRGREKTYEAKESSLYSRVLESLASRKTLVTFDPSVLTRVLLPVISEGKTRSPRMLS